MFRKLMKHEWHDTYKAMLTVNLALILLTLIGCCILNTSVFEHRETSPVAVLIVFFYIMSLATCGILATCYLCIRFYRNLFGKEGYLMHALPVKPAQLLHSKLIVGYAWSMLNSLLCIASVALLAFLALFQYAKANGVDGISPLLQWGGMDNARTIDLESAFEDIFGYKPLGFLLQFCILQVFSDLASLLTGYVSILLGQLVEKYKVMSAIGFYIALYLANQTICSIMITLPSLTALSKEGESFLKFYCKTMMHYAIVSQVLAGAALYLAALLLMRRKQNL